MENLNIQHSQVNNEGQLNARAQISQQNNNHLFGPNYSQQNEFAGGTPFFPNYTNENQERMQGMVQGIGDFQQNFVPKKGPYSRQSSEGESGIPGQPLYHRLDYSDQAVHSNNHFDENCKYLTFLFNIDSNRSWIDSSSDYQEQLSQHNFMYSPDQQLQNRPAPHIYHQHPQGYNNYQYNQGFQNQGYYQQKGPQPVWDSYHQNFKPQMGYQNRANSHDKLAYQHNVQQHYMQPNFAQNEEYETHSAASSGNQSAFSDGDVYNPKFVAQNNQYYGYYGEPNNFVRGPPSNQAIYGFTPNIQFSGSNQKHHASSTGMSTKFPNDQTIGSQEYYQDEFGMSNQPQGSDIQITDVDVNLQGIKIGVSPRRNSNDSKFQSVKKVPLSHLGQGYSPQFQDLNMEKNPHHHGQMHSQYKTPSPYRNNEIPGGMYQPNIHAPQNIINRLRVTPNYSEPFYPNYQFQNQKVQSQVQYPGNMYNPGMRGQINDQYSHIGMMAPPKLKNIEFSHGDSLSMNHNRPFPAVQYGFNPNQGFYQGQPMYPPQQHYPPHGAMKSMMNAKTTGSQERDPNYQPLLFSQQNSGGPSKTVVNTPKNNLSQDNASVSSANSNNAQFSNAINDQNDAALLQLTKQYDECQNPQQKLEIIKGNVHKLALNQKGSRFLQRQVTKAPSNVISFFLEEIRPYLKELMVDNYGNYFCQCLLQSCSGDQRLSILKSIEKDFLEICCNPKGTHAIQKIFDLVNLPEEEDFIKNALIGNVVKLSMDLQGTHVIQKVLSSFEEDKRQFIFEEIYDQFISLAKNNNGLCVIKKLIQFTKEKSQSDALMSKIQENANALSQDQYGNYAITEIINSWDPELCKPIFIALCPKVIQLSNQKHSSNVIEKCLEKADENIRSQFIREISASEKLTNTIRNQFGNFVIQTALKLAKGQDKDQLIASIKKCIPDMQDKKIREKWEKLVYDAINGTNTAQQNNQNEQSENDANSASGGGGSTSHRKVKNLRSNSSENPQ